MNTQNIENKEVTLLSYGGKKIKRIVVRDLGNVILVAKPEEIQAASVENRQAISVGFKKKYIVSDL